MKKKFKVILIVTIALVLAACSSNDATSDSTEESEGGNVQVTPPGTFPIVEEPVTLTVLMGGNALVEDFVTNEFTKWYEEFTNVQIKFEVTPAEGKEEILNLRLASGDLPDIIINMPITPAQQMIYGSQGMFLALNDYIDELGYYIHDVFEEDPTAWDILTSPDGKIYSMPNTTDCFHCKFAQKAWIYQPWLDELGLEMPETTEEFYQVLKAFKEAYPNSVPLAGATTGWMTEIDGFFMNPFIYNNRFMNRSTILKDEKVDVIYNKPEWQEGLRYLHRLYSEGLLAQETFTQDQQQLRRLGENPEPILGAFVGGHPGLVTEIGGESGRWLEYVALPPLEGPSGQRLAGYNPFITHGGKLVINANTKYPEVAFRWADGFYNQDVFMRQKYGIEGEEWAVPKEGMVGINGLPAVWEPLVPYGEVSNNHWQQSAPILETSDFRLGQAVIGEQETDFESILFNESNNKYDPYKPDIDILVPPLFFTDEQSAELADLETTIHNFLDEMIARFVIGEVDIDAGWDNYIDTLENMNLQRYIEILQEAYDVRSK